MRRASKWKILLASLVVLLALTACEKEIERGGVEAIRQVADGDPAQGQELLASWGCGSCHHIPGVTGADAYVGPPLDAWSRRHYIAGSLTNTPENLMKWIMDPQAIEPGTAMPDMDVSEEAARNIAAYLYTLEE